MPERLNYSQYYHCLAVDCLTCTLECDPLGEEYYEPELQESEGER